MFLLLFTHFLLGERAWIVFVANVQPAKQQLLLRDSFHGTQKVKERRNIKE